MGPVVGLAIIMVGIYHIYNAVFNYFADTYLLYASSAIAAQSFARNISGFAFPLFIQAMYRKLTFTWASFLISMIGTVLAITPFVLFSKGATIRAHSKVVQEVLKLREEIEENRRQSRMNSRQNSRQPSPCRTPA